MVQVPELHRGTTCAIRAFKAPGALRADRAPRGFQLHEEAPFPWSSKRGGPLLELLELRFVSLSSESSITSHPAFPDVGLTSYWSTTIHCTLILRSWHWSGTLWSL